MANKTQTPKSDDKPVEKDKVKVEDPKPEPEKTDKSTEEGKPKVTPEDSKKSEEDGKFQEALKQRDGTISALDKKNQALTDKIDRMESGLKEAIGVEPEGEEEFSPEDEIRQMRSELNALKGEKRVNSIANSLKTDEGEDMPDIVKEKALEMVDLENTKPEELEGAIKRQASILYETYQADRTTSSSEPEPSGKEASRLSDSEFTVRR